MKPSWPEHIENTHEHDYMPWKMANMKNLNT